MLVLLVKEVSCFLLERLTKTVKFHAFIVCCYCSDSCNLQGCCHSAADFLIKTISALNTIALKLMFLGYLQVDMYSVDNNSIYNKPRHASHLKNLKVKKGKGSGFI